MVTPARTRDAALLAASLVLFACIAPHAIPVFTQDWAWPLTRGQGWQMAHVATNVWRDSGFGSPWTAPNSWTVGVTIGVACAWLGPYLALLAFTGATIVLATFGTAALLRVCGVGAFAQAAGAIVYAASPVFTNKLHAGHIYYLVGFACLPLSCTFLVRSAVGARGAAFLSGLFPALGAAQFQFFEIGVVGRRDRGRHRARAGLALAAFAARSKRSGPHVRAVVAGAALTVIGGIATAGYDGPLAGPLEWMFANVPLATAFREFYHQAALLALGTALLAGVAADAPGRLGRLAGRTPAVLLAAARGPYGGYPGSRLRRVARNPDPPARAFALLRSPSLRRGMAPRVHESVLRAT